MSKLVILFGFYISILSASAQFMIPPVNIEALEPSGFRASIPDTTGIKLFGFHARINEPLGDKEDGTVSGNVKQAVNGRWTFENPNVSLNKGDSIYYWVFVQYEYVGFRKDMQIYTVNQLYSKYTSTSGRNSKIPVCPISKTITNLQGNVCKGKLIFEDDFNNGIDVSKWTIEHKFPPNQQENEFSSYQKSNVKHVNGNIEIVPTLQINQEGWDAEKIENDQLDFGSECTGVAEECISNPSEIVHPVVSGKITTRNKFSFKYGKIEVKAKLPIGDWIYPEISLRPTSSSKYGNENYDSGVIKIAFSRGNNKFEVGGQDLGNKLLNGGAILTKESACRSARVYSSYSPNPWGQDFHTYSVMWDSDKIIFQVDGKPYGNISTGFSSLAQTCSSLVKPASLWKTGETMAPFDQEFYLSFGVGIGGILDFPNVPSGKPWKNESRKAKKDFWAQYQQWYSQWADVSKKLIIDYVKVWAA